MDFLSSIPFLSTAIAIIISWALFAILCSLAQEAVAQLIADRGRFMRKYILKQLQDYPNGVNWGSLLYLHGAVDLLSRATNQPTSHISPDLFAKTLVDVVGGAHLVQMQIQLVKENAAKIEFVDQVNNYEHSVLYNFKAATQLLKPSDLLTFFQQSLKDAEMRANVNSSTDPDKQAKEADVYKFLTENIEKWYADFSDRLSLWYKKHVRKRLLIIGILLGIFINVDSIQLFRFYNANPETRVAIINYYKENKERLDSLANTPDSVWKKRTQIETTGDKSIIRQVVTDTLYKATTDFIHSMDSLQKATNTPVGTKYNLFVNYKMSFLEWFFKIAGILISGFAASFGAPFWFDVLRKVVR
jgi:hypothetical protein